MFNYLYTYIVVSMEIIVMNEIYSLFSRLSEIKIEIPSYARHLRRIIYYCGRIIYVSILLLLRPKRFYDIIIIVRFVQMFHKLE